MKINPTKTLSNPYYFIKDNVLFEISNNKHGDEDCASKKVTYQTVDKVVKKGETYYDLHGELQKAEEDGTVQVKTNDLNLGICKEVFPSFEVTYLKPSTEEGSEGETLYVYYFLQTMIKDGDTFVDEKFVMNTHDETDDTYVTRFYKTFKEEIFSLIKNGYTIEQVKNKFPHYCFENAKYSINGFEYKGGVDGFSPLTDEELEELVIEGVNENVIKYANKLLAKHSFKLKDDVEELITTENTEKIQ